MAYALNQGVDGPVDMDKVQSRLLIGLPVIAVLLSLGAIERHHIATPAEEPATVIPVISTVGSSSSGNGSASDNSNSGQPNSSNGSNPEPAADTGSAAISPASTSSSAGTSAPGGTAAIVGGRGGGISGGPSEGVLPVTYTLTVPPVDLQAGGKSVVSSDGTTVVVN